MAMAMDKDASSELKSDNLFQAAEKGDTSIFENLPEASLARARILRNEDGRSLLHVASSFSQLQVVRVLSAGDLSVNGVNDVDEEGWAPIHSAASTGNFQIVKTLIDRGADVNIANNGRTPIHYAASKGRLKIAEILISNGTNINKKDKVGCIMT